VKYLLAFCLISLSGCTWLATHPQIAVEAIELSEEALSDLYRYESKTLSPAPPQPHAEYQLPPFKPGMPYAPQTWQK